MESIANQRNFDYDVRALLGIDLPVPPAPSTGEVNLTISGLTGTWAGLSDGIHNLDGREIYNAGLQHFWYYPEPRGSSFIYFRVKNSYSNLLIYDGGTTAIYTSISTGINSNVTLQDRLVGTPSAPIVKSVRGATFSFFKGSDWVPGGM